MQYGEARRQEKRMEEIYGRSPGCWFSRALASLSSASAIRSPVKAQFGTASATTPMYSRIAASLSLPFCSFHAVNLSFSRVLSPSRCDAFSTLKSPTRTCCASPKSLIFAARKRRGVVSQGQSKGRAGRCREGRRSEASESGRKCALALTGM